MASVVFIVEMRFCCSLYFLLLLFKRYPSADNGDGWFLSGDPICAQQSEFSVKLLTGQEVGVTPTKAVDPSRRQRVNHENVLTGQEDGVKPAISIFLSQVNPTELADENGSKVNKLQVQIKDGW